MQILQLAFQFIRDKLDNRNIGTVDSHYISVPTTSVPTTSVPTTSVPTIDRFPSKNRTRTKDRKPPKNRHGVSATKSDRELKLIWDFLIDSYFPGWDHLKNYQILWSGRIQTRCLASCNIQKRIVRVAGAMRLEECTPHLEALLYHELCHAVVGIRIERGRRKIHTREFKEMERKHPRIIALDAWINSGGWTRAVRRHTLIIKRR